MKIAFILGSGLFSTLALMAVATPSRSVTSAERQCLHQGGTALVPSGATLFGEDGEDAPGISTQVSAFRIDRTEVTNRQFEAFVNATGYVTDAEKQGEGAVFIQPHQLERGLEDPRGWWKLVAGATWRHPQGPSSEIEDKADLPVVQVTYNDAVAYAKWRGGSLPTQLQWERAARASQVQMRDRHSWAVDAVGHPTANAWDGVFPLINTAKDGFVGIAPVGCYPASSFGLYDMVGNVWEWTREADGAPGPLRGGSYLCARNYCANYTPAGLQEQEGDLATSHAGFRVVYPVDDAAGQTKFH